MYQLPHLYNQRRRSAKNTHTKKHYSMNKKKRRGYQTDASSCRSSKGALAKQLKKQTPFSKAESLFFLQPQINFKAVQSSNEDLNHCPQCFKFHDFGAAYGVLLKDRLSTATPNSITGFKLKKLLMVNKKTIWFTSWVLNIKCEL